MRVSSKGFEFEKEQSKSYKHSSALALLVSPLVLRERGLGQIDYAEFMPKTKVKEARAQIVECKFTLRGTGLAPQQWARLKNSARFLGELLDCPVELKIASQRKTLE